MSDSIAYSPLSLVWYPPPYPINRGVRYPREFANFNSPQKTSVHFKNLATLHIYVPLFTLLTIHSSKSPSWPMEHTDVPTLGRLLKEGQLEPYIRHIRFPRYKNFAPDTRIDFFFPITAIVGPNGTNKSSIIKALFGTPGYSNLGNYWFSTSVDPIEKGGDELARPCFIHGYWNPSIEKVVEVLKTRIQKTGDPDYWEPSRPVAKYDMEPMRDVPGNTPGRSKTRWETIDKDVVLVDFRQTLSAFDRVFYSADSDTDRKVQKALIRRRAPHLRSTLMNGAPTYFFYGMERIINKENVSLTAAQVATVSEILGRKYSEIRLVHHNLFGSPGYTVQMRYADLQYTEAFAGSGEFATVVLIWKITNAKPSSLILLDEPEVSLFPGAQRRLLNFLFDFVKKHHHQVVMATHSPSMIQGLPETAIKIIGLDERTGLVSVISQQALPEEAFFAVGAPAAKPVVYVEDHLAVQVVLRALRNEDPPLLDLIRIEILPGGAATILGKYAPIFAGTERTDILLLLDGDKRPATGWPDPTSIPTADDGTLDDTITRLAQARVSFFTDGGAASDKHLKQSIKAKRRFIGWCRQYVAYLPGLMPEAFILGKCRPTVTDEPKTWFLNEAPRELKLAPNEKVTADHILDYQKRLLLEISPKDTDMVNIAKTIRGFFRKQNNNGSAS